MTSAGQSKTCGFQSPVRRMRSARSTICGSSMPTECGTPALRYHSRAAAAIARMTARIESSPARREVRYRSADMQLQAQDTTPLHYDPRMAHAFTIGVEEEFQIVDPDTWELRSHVSELLASTTSLGDQIKRELHQSIVEVGTKICADVTELEDEVCHIRRELSQSAERV